MLPPNEYFVLVPYLTQSVPMPKHCSACGGDPRNELYLLGVTVDGRTPHTWLLVLCDQCIRDLETSVRNH